MKCILSPHLDDAALSLGGTLLSAPQDFLVINIFSETGWSSGDHSPNEIAKINLDEEKEAMARIGTRFIELNNREVALRNYESWYSPVQWDRERNMINGILASLIDIMKAEKIEEIFLPISPKKRHVDHLITRSFLRTFFSLGYTCWLYEDLPYAAYGELDEELEIVSNFYDLSSEKTDITNSIGAKREILKIYKSQLSENDINLTINFTQGKDGKHTERIWRVNDYRI